MAKCVLTGIAAAGIALLTACTSADTPRLGGEPGPGPDPCLSLGGWVEPGSGRRLNGKAVMSDMVDRPVVLLGESHVNPEDHRWQQQMLVSLYTLNPSMIVGFEMFPREKQPVLDRWVSGDLDEQAFLDAAEWGRVWGFEPALYLPLLRFVRNNGVPAVALNVDRQLVSQVGDRGWDAIAMADREGLGDPARPSEAYVDSLETLYRHGHPGEEGTSWSENDSAAFQRFVEAQLTWDRAMAEALHEGRRTSGAALAVGIMGRGHVAYGHGVAHQLDDLGSPDTGLLLPVAVGEGCGGKEPGLADALFTVPDWQPSEERRVALGVYLEDAGGGALVVKVIPHSVAEAAGIRAEDTVVGAAGRPVSGRAELVATIRQQAPGTWLPITVRRGGGELNLVAKFPPRN